MEENEKKLLLEIDELHAKLLQEPYGQWRGDYIMKPNGYSYSSNAKKMLQKIIELNTEFNPTYLSDQDVSAYDHTCDKEINYVEYHYDKTLKSKAPKIRTTEFISSIHEANQQIAVDLFSLFDEITNLKRE